MAIGVLSIIQHRFFQEYQSETLLNVQHYIIVAMETSSDDLADYAQPMFEHWSTALAPGQSNLCYSRRSELYEVNGLDYGVYAADTNVPGTQVGEPEPSFMSVSIQQVRQSRATRHGWKRFGGITENQVSGQALTSAGLSQWQDIAANLFPFNLTLNSQEFPATRSITFQPIIWGGNDPDYPTGRYSAISSYVVKNVVTTQNTRKAGRGI